MDEEISKRVRFCRVSELDAKGHVTRWIDEWRDEITAVKTAEGIVTMSSVCPHHGGELVPDAASGRMVCKWHGWEFDLKEGKCQSYNIAACLRIYESRVVDEYLEVERD